MNVVQCFVTALMLSAQLVLTSPVIGRQKRNKDYRECEMCAAGHYLKTCTECEPCPPGTYTSKLNREASCHSCFPDCIPDFHLEVVKKCTNTSNLKCECEAGFVCTDRDATENCRDCKSEEIPGTVRPGPHVTLVQMNQTQASTGQNSTSARPCRSPNCGLQVVSPVGNSTDKTREFNIGNTNKELAAILCPLLAIGFIAVVILFCVHRPGEETCFKLAIAKLCNERGRDASFQKAKESTQQYPRDSSNTKHQPFSLPGANLGPVHVHNAGTVIFSLLSQFTGQADPTGEQQKRRQTESNEEEERDCPVFHPSASPGLHLSQEERTGETDRVFFPSQEQGKDCHVSKEEVA
ncbi:uncharacterized protein ACJ7VT_020700 [Polymixia lowei]